jgi:hypothetical protein
MYLVAVGAPFFIIYPLIAMAIRLFFVVVIVIMVRSFLLEGEGGGVKGAHR